MTLCTKHTLDTKLFTKHTLDTTFCIKHTLDNTLCTKHTLDEALYQNTKQHTQFQTYSVPNTLCT